MENLQELFEDTIKDLYNAEKQFLKAMPKLVTAAQDSKLKRTIQDHMVQTEAHISRLEEVAKIGGFKPTGKVCKAAQGLVEECQEHLEEGTPGPTLDAAIICCAQKNEHYEITSYGTVIAWADVLSYPEISALLQQTLSEEISADDLLTEVSSSVNTAAASGNSSKTRKPHEDKGKSQSNTQKGSGAKATVRSSINSETPQKGATSGRKEKVSSRR